MKKIFSIILIILISTSIIGCSNTKDLKLSTKEKVKDFEYMYKTIKDGYPFLEVNKRVNNIDWVANKEKYLERIKNTKNDEEFINEMSLIVQDLNNDHTGVIDDKKVFEFFRDGYYKNNLYNFWVNKKVITRYESIGSVLDDTEDVILRKEITLKDIVPSKIGYMYLPQMYTDEKIRKEDMRVIAQYIQTLSNHQALIIDIRGNTGGDDVYWYNIVSKLIDTDIVNIGYMLFKEDSKVIKNYINKRISILENIEDLPKDILHNAPKESIDMFTSFNKKNLHIEATGFNNFNGNIYLLVDDFVYSSAEAFAIFCKDTGFATIIGEKTGGDGGGIDPVLFNLKNSGLIVRMTSNMFLTNNGLCNEEFKTIPDYEINYCERTLDFRNDKCIDKVLELEKIK